MKKEELITNIKLNSEKIYRNLSSVFGIEKEEFENLVFNIIDSFKYNKKLNEKEYSINIFSIDNLIELKSSLTEIGLPEEKIKKIIVKSPILILYSDNLSNIYYLYKGNKYYGYTVLDNEEYVTYLSNDNLSSNIISNNYVTEKMLDYYNVKIYSKEAFDKLESGFKLKNYYFKEKPKTKSH